MPTELNETIDRQIRMLLHQRHGLAIGLVRDIIAINDADEFQARILRQCLLHLGEPGVLIGRGRRRGNNGDLAFALRCQLGRELRHRLTGSAHPTKARDERHDLPSRRRNHKR